MSVLVLVIVILIRIEDIIGGCHIEACYVYERECVCIASSRWMCSYVGSSYVVMTILGCVVIGCW